MKQNGTKQTLNENTPIMATAVRFGADGPVSEPMELLHRGAYGFYPLAVKEHGETWRELGAVREGQGLLPSVLELLGSDAYVGINASFGTLTRTRTSRRSNWLPIPGETPGAEQKVTRTITQRYTPTVKATGLPQADHSSTTIAWLNAAFVDIDCYKLGLSVGDTLGKLVNMQDAGDLPLATVFVRSGRGLWVLWFLVDVLNPGEDEGKKIIHKRQHDAHTSQKATAHSLRLFTRAQGALVRKLAHLGADLKAVDAARRIPFPGTLKTTAEQRVEYWFQSTHEGPPTYTLPELLHALGEGVVLHEPAAVTKAFTSNEQNPRRQAAGLKGWKANWTYKVRDLELLRELRRGCWQASGVRHEFMWMYAATMYRAGTTKGEVEAHVYAFALEAGFMPTVAKRDAASACKQGFKKYKYSHVRRETFATRLNVTAAEQSHLDAANPRPQAQASKLKADVQTRREAIRTVIATQFGGVPPSVRVMHERLVAMSVNCGNFQTVHRDYKAMGLMARGKPGRPARLPLG